MDAPAEQIRQALAQGLTVYEVAQAFGLDVTAVRAAVGAFTADDAADMRGVLYALAMDRSVKASDRIKAATYIHEEAMGRNEKRAAAAASIMGIMELNQRLIEARQKARPAAALTVQSAETPIIDAKVIEFETA